MVFHQSQKILILDKAHEKTFSSDLNMSILKYTLEYEKKEISK